MSASAAPLFSNFCKPMSCGLYATHDGTHLRYAFSPETNGFEIANAADANKSQLSLGRLSLQRNGLYILSPVAWDKIHMCAWNRRDYTSEDRLGPKTLMPIPMLTPMKVMQGYLGGCVGLVLSDNALSTELRNYLLGVWSAFWVAQELLLDLQREEWHTAHPEWGFTTTSLD